MIHKSEKTTNTLRYLGESGLLNDAEKAEVQAMMQSDGSDLDHAVMSLGFIQETPLLEAIAKANGLGFVSSQIGVDVDRAAYDRLGADFWWEKAALPTIIPNSTGGILISRPFDQDMWSEIEFFLQEERSPILAGSALIQNLHETLDGRATASTAEKTSHSQVKISEADGAAAKIIDGVFSRCIELQASDIHLSRQGNVLNVLARVHGKLQPIPVRGGVDAKAVFSSLKLMAGMNIVERRLPQDGSCQFNHGGRIVELRVSTLPIADGEAIVCRVLDQSASPQNWTELGFSPELAGRMRTIIEQPFGLIVISGPTGSGKTTTLYAALRHLADGTRKIISVEDPIEQKIAGVTQVQVDSAIGLGFGRVLRTSLRHDPDVLMIGEVRDEETAEIACRAALVGRLVLATVHASSAKLVRERFVNLGVPAYLVDEVLIAVVSQRLERETCSSCNGVGCDGCDQSGATGRALQVAVLEN